MLKRRVLPLLALAALLASCASPDPKLYALATVPGPAQGGGPRVIVLRTVGLARYLERPQIVLSSEQYRLNVSSNDWWGEPLGAMLGRTLIAELAQRLPGSGVFSETGAIAVDPDMRAEVNIQRMDTDSSGTLILDAQIAVSPTRGRQDVRTRTLHIAVPPPSPGVTGQVAATSIAIGQLADALAALLRGARPAA
ncbi:MAG: membrane integrity-associated transporter subunit PqiC [Acetobacteraceae bacterium]|nr:membrane integrity-associated transporter subunit PqiC [Acetobacteraceae bacterium]